MKGELPDGVVAQHTRLIQLNEEIRNVTGEPYLLQTVHDGMHRYFFRGSEVAVIGIAAALNHMELRWREVFRVGPKQDA